MQAQYQPVDVDFVAAMFLQDVRRLVDAMVSARCTNEHTHGSAIAALDKAGRFDMAIQHFEELYRCASICSFHTRASVALMGGHGAMPPSIS